MKLHTINTGFFKLDGGAMFGVVPKSIWNRLNKADENNMCNWAMRCLLIESGSRKILIDTGIGTKQSEKFYGYYYLNGNDSLDGSLQALGIERSDITDVILTHLHFDHVGGAVAWNKQQTGYEPAFPNATFHLSESHLQHALNPNPREKASFLAENYVPLQEAGVLNFVKADEELFSNVYCRMVNGHTVSMVCPEIHTPNGVVFYGADLFPSAAHIPTNYVMAYDIEPLKSMEERVYWNQKISSENWNVFFEHDREVECAKIVKNE
ncbi:MAG: MBL fold metallo-hydrolase, partial [Bacteroidia bacterium]|nr:MBL fold metallo-hydrolase [Bacteroidia bacterium]